MSEQEKTQDRKKRRPMLPVGSRRRRWLFRSLVVIALVITGIAMFPQLRDYLTHEATDDAYLSGDTVPVSVQVKGRVTKLFVSDNQQVEAGQPLLQVDPEDYRLAQELASQNLAAEQAREIRLTAAIQEAEAAVSQARAELDSAKEREDLAIKERDRYQPLVAVNLVSQSRFDQAASRCREAHSSYLAARAALARTQATIKTLQAERKAQAFKIEAARQNLNQARLDLQRTLVRAPVAGIVAQRNVDVGKFLEAGQAFLSLVDTRNVWVIANFKETQMGNIHNGQPVTIAIDAYPDHTVSGHVESVQPGTGANFSLLPPENATGNFVKIVQRVPVKIAIDSPPDSDYPLLPGLSVVPKVDIRSIP